MSGYCCGKAGANSEAAVPSGFRSARYSPLALSFKSACNGWPGIALLTPEANTTMNALAGRFVLGKVQRAWCAGSSVSDHPARFTLEALGLKSSIQSE